MRPRAAPRTTHHVEVSGSKFKVQSYAPRITHYTLYALLLGVAFALRWQFLRTTNPYPDEFVTLLAMDMIRQKGVPVLPSGLFYEHGLLYSYLAAMASFLGDPLLWGRMVSLVFGLATVALTWLAGRRWFSPATGLLAATGLALAPAAVQWSGRVRMYALLQFLVLLAVWGLVEGLRRNRPALRWGAAGAYFAATLTQFAAVALLPPLVLAEAAIRHLRRERWYASPALWLRWGALGAATLVAFVVKRAGQPKGIAPLGAVNPAGGVWQVVQIYGDLSLDVGKSWAALAPFFLQPPVLVFSLFAAGLLLVALGAGIAGRRSPVVRGGAGIAFLGVLLVVTTLEMLFLVAPDRKDDKYLFMLLPVLLLLGAAGLSKLLERAGAQPNRPRTLALAALFGVALGWYARPEIAALLSDVGEDYTTAFIHVAAHWQPGDAVLTGTPAAAYHYLHRNDYYAVQAGGPYDYRILPGPNGQPVERWLGSPWIHTLDELNAVFRRQRVWLVLERWGLLVQYYDPLFMQNILAQTEFVREDNGVIVLRSLPDPRPLRETPAVPADALLAGTEGDSGQLKLLGYTLEGTRLTLYWQAQSPLRFDYTVFVNVQDEAGQTVTQVDHRPLGSVYPTTLWQPGQTIRETSTLDLPPGVYHLRVGMYRLETGERLWVPSDKTLQNMV
ncbi:MAG: hypothetical protein D6796_05140, partial [Caldilineae bacterium]